ncbi:MBL fold metallo-hydrolase [Streptomyces sp. NPDC048291]|uniref:MBL fold metallo-hydrolase n=1 Tax=Streptomyces sp. NPDC048291 TaxID=3365530 RepID=UPI003710BF27
MKHVESDPPQVELSTFTPEPKPAEVWRGGDVVVSAVAVHHEPVSDAVAYRVETSDGAVVISGDTRVCAEVEEMAAGADVLVREACRNTALADAIRGTAFEAIFEYHADTVALGAMAERAGVRYLVLTHMIPPPGTPEEEAGFVEDVRKGG